MGSHVSPVERVGVRMVSATKERAGNCRKRLESNRGKERKLNLKNKKIPDN